MASNDLPTPPDDDGASPLVSVVMSVYNGEAFLDRAMASILDQTYAAIEFIVIDDGSTDGSAVILKAHAERDPRVRVIKQANTGLTRALIRGVDEARGDLIARMDVDDFSWPERIERQVAALAARPEAVAATCRLRFVDDAGASIDGRRVDEPALLAWRLVFSNRLGGHGQIMFRRAAYRAAGGYDPAFRFAQDHDLWVRIAALGPIVGADAILYDYRLAHAASITQRNRGAQADLSLSVTERAFAALTGTPIDRPAAADLRAFWTTAAGLPFTSERAREVDRLLRVAHAAFRGTPKQGRRLAADIAARWLDMADRASLSRPLDTLRLIALAIRWRPAIAARAARRLGRRLTGAARRSAGAAG